MFLWYILTSDAINYIDYYIDIPISDFNMYAVNMFIIGVFLFLILYLYVRTNKTAAIEDNS